MQLKPRPSAKIKKLLYPPWARRGAASIATAAALGLGGCGAATAEPEVGNVADSDSDRVVDSADQCPQDPEDHDGFEDADGCPDPDNDQDRIADGDDQCPDAAENWNGIQDEDGCPDRSAGVVIAPSPIMIRDRLQFAQGSDALDQNSQAILAAIAATLRGNPEITLMEIHGHESRSGQTPRAISVSQMRANTVRDYLVSLGVASSRLSIRSLGVECPIATNATAAGRGQNDRVEFRIIETTDGPAGDRPACE